MTVVYRIDKFAVPEPARAEFWRNVRRTHSVLKLQDGFLDDVLLEQRSGPGTMNVVTIVRWSSGDDLPAARSAAQASHAEAGFDPAEFYARAGIVADLGNYVEV